DFVSFFAGIEWFLICEPEMSPLAYAAAPPPSARNNAAAATTVAGCVRRFTMRFLLLAGPGRPRSESARPDDYHRFSSGNPPPGSSMRAATSRSGASARAEMPGPAVRAGPGSSRYAEWLVVLLMGERQRSSSSLRRVLLLLPQRGGRS